MIDGHRSVKFLGIFNRRKELWRVNKGMEQSICRSLVSKAHPTSNGLECDWLKRLCGVGEGSGPQDWMPGEVSRCRASRPRNRSAGNPRAT